MRADERRHWPKMPRWMAEWFECWTPHSVDERAADAQDQR
jgi:hypothetical protein